MTKHLKEKFKEYDEENPKVYNLFVRFAKEVKSTGRRVYSAKAIFERIRWFVEVETTGDIFKVNNNYPAHYARKMMDEYPDFEGFFRVRRLQ